MAIDPMSASLADENTLFVLNKTDIIPESQNLRKQVSEALGLSEDSDRMLFVSIEARQGLDKFSDRLRRLVEERYAYALQGNRSPAHIGPC